MPGYVSFREGIIFFGVNFFPTYFASYVEAWGLFCGAIAQFVGAQLGQVGPRMEFGDLKGGV